MSKQQISFLSSDDTKQWLDVRGWLLTNAANKLYELAVNSPEHGAIVEIGSYAGKSTICLAHAVEQRTQTKKNIHTFDIAYQFDFLTNLKKFNVMNNVIAKEKSSLEAADIWNLPIGFLYIDGHHGKAHAYADLLVWDQFVMQNGIIALDDTAGYLMGPLLQLVTALSSGSYQFIGEVGGISFLRKNHNIIANSLNICGLSEIQLCRIFYLGSWAGAFDLQMRKPGLAQNRNQQFHQKLMSVLQYIWRNSPQKISNKILNYVRNPNQKKPNVISDDFDCMIKEISDLKQSNCLDSIYISTLGYLEAVILFQRNDFDKAILLFIELSQLDDKTIFIHYKIPIKIMAELRLAMIYDLTGKRHQAIELYKQIDQNCMISEIKQFVKSLILNKYTQPVKSNRILLREYNIELSQYKNIPGISD